LTGLKCCCARLAACMLQLGRMEGAAVGELAGRGLILHAAMV
jgi:hypothetical protein